MFKKIFGIILDIIFIVLIIGIIYYFFILKKDNTMIENVQLQSFSPNYEDTISNSQALTNLNVINENTNNFSTNSISTNNKYYYNQLGYNAKLIYTALENNIDNLKKDNFKINFSTKFNDLLNKQNGKSVLDKSFQAALDAFFYDHPELFYIDLTKITLYTKYTTIGSKTTYTVSLAPQNNKNYLSDSFSSESQVDNAINQIEQMRNSIVSRVNGSNYNKALIVHDTLVDMLEYDQNDSNSNTHNIYGAFVNRSVVCEGYAKSFKYIMDSLNIPCILVGGVATNNTSTTESHMWNYIQLDGNWYGVDVTWDDPLIIGGSSKKSSRVRRDYFCKGASSFKLHKADGKISQNGETFSIPTLSSKDYKNK